MGSVLSLVTIQILCTMNLYGSEMLSGNRGKVGFDFLGSDGASEVYLTPLRLLLVTLINEGCCKLPLPEKTGVKQGGLHGL
jgi:hypothetical protein